MATLDPTNVLFKIAHPDLYARNPFNLLNLPIDATAKDIRRRREEKSPYSFSSTNRGIIEVSFYD